MGSINQRQKVQVTVSFPFTIALAMIEHAWKHDEHHEGALFTISDLPRQLVASPASELTLKRSIDVWHFETPTFELHKMSFFSQRRVRNAGGLYSRLHVLRCFYFLEP